MIKIIYLCSSYKCDNPTEVYSILCREAKTKEWCCFLTNRCDANPRILVFWRESIQMALKMHIVGYDSTFPPNTLTLHPNYTGLSKRAHPLLQVSIVWDVSSYRICKINLMVVNSIF